MDDISTQTQWLDATAQAALVAGGEVSAVELADAAIERIERIDGRLNAVVLTWYDRARQVARAIDEGSNATVTGPFAGVPFLLKDLGAPMAGETMTNGNAALAEAKPIFTHDSTLVSRFKDAGLVALGRSSSPELGSLPVTEPIAHGPTRNPWDTGRTPGGSSGGAAAAVAAGIVPIAHASDGGGSIRIPAACAGLIGLKPSQGRITMGPDVDESGLSVHLCVSRSVRDTARLLDAVHGPGIGDTVIAPPPVRPYIDEVGADPGRLRIGLIDTHPLGGTLHDDCVTAARSAAGMLEGLGHQVELGHPAILADTDFQRRFMALWATGRAVGIDTMGAILGRPLTEDEVEPVNWAQAKFAETLSSVAYAEALAAVSQFRRELQQWWTEGWDLLLSPTLAEPPTRIGEHDARPGDPMAGMKRAAKFIAFTPPFNTSGQPAINVPLHWNDDGLPIGVQLAAAYGREDVLLAVAAQLEAAHPWADRHPAVS
ncbi:MAG: amidase [Acidimicrobiia bacterium]|nr:amidase [Acidimicrobiia bacterium]